MKRLIFSFLILNLTIISLFGNIQNGIVRTIKRPGKKVEYVSGMQISVKGLPGSVRSKEKGRFQLELRQLNLFEGSRFSIKSVFKPGYELYDQDAVYIYSSSSPIEVVVKNLKLEAQEQQQFAKEMYGGAEKQYKKRISELENQLIKGRITEEAYREQLKEYQFIFEKYQSQINAIAKRYAGLDYASIDPLTESINESFSKGDYERADSLLNSLGEIESKAIENIAQRDNIKNKIAIGNSLITQGEEELTLNSRDANRLAELMYAKHLSALNHFENDSAAYYLTLRTQLVPENCEFLINAGYFYYYYLNNFTEALDYLTKAYELMKADNMHSLLTEAYCLNEMGLVYSEIGNFEEALSCYETYMNGFRQRE